jgi:hypothetical protein
MSVFLPEMIGGTHHWRPVHYGMLAHDSSLGIAEDDKLRWFVDPPVAKAELNTLIGMRDCAMPQATREINNIGGFFGVKADDEGR